MLVLGDPNDGQQLERVNELVVLGGRRPVELAEITGLGAVEDLTAYAWVVTTPAGGWSRPTGDAKRINALRDAAIHHGLAVVVLMPKEQFAAFAAYAPDTYSVRTGIYRIDVEPAR